MPRRRLLALTTLLLLLVAGGCVRAEVEPVNQTRDGVAIEGHDPVAYFAEGRAAEGSAEHTFEWQGAIWHFASAEHRDRFTAEPERYAPRYGGYCAWAVSRGKTAGIDPEAFTVHDGKLYLNYSPKIHRRWLQDRDANIARADRNWPRILNED